MAAWFLVFLQLLFVTNHKFSNNLEMTEARDKKMNIVGILRILEFFDEYFNKMFNIKPTGLNLGRVFNYRCGRVST